MQAIAELAFLEVADEAVDPRDRFGRRSRCIETEIVFEARGARLVADRGDQALAAGGIETVGGRIFVEELFEPAQAFRHRGLFERRRQMADGDGTDAPLGLRGFAGIVDDEGIDDGQIADQGFGPTRGRQRHGFPGQPFQRAVRAHVHDGINPLPAEPEIERDIGMARRAGEIVIVGIARGRIATLGLDRDDRVAALDRSEVERAVAAARIGLRRAPGLREIILQTLRKARERRAVIGDAPGQLLLEQCLAKRLDGRNIEAGFSEIGHQRFDRGERVETDCMRDLVRTSGIVREHDRQPLRGGRRLRKPPPGRNAGGDGLHALFIRPDGPDAKIADRDRAPRPT